MRKIIVLFILLFLFVACENKHEQKHERNLKFVTSTKDLNKSSHAYIPKMISIYRFENFSLQTAERLENKLKKYFPNVVIKKEVLSLPLKHFNKERNRYRGTGLLEELSKHLNGDAVIGLTDYVIFKPNEISQTYGIMGVSPVGTYKCVVSSKVPASGKEQGEDNFVKLSLHELGHAFGLNHCADQHCYMVDAEHKMKFPQTTGFCESCKAKLNAKGWILN